MTQDQKQEEYQLLLNSKRSSIQLHIPDGPTLNCHGSWDYATNLDETSLKTTTEIKIEHPLLKVEHLDLLPVTSMKVYKVTVKRHPESNLKNHGNNRN